MLFQTGASYEKQSQLLSGSAQITGGQYRQQRMLCVSEPEFSAFPLTGISWVGPDLPLAITSNSARIVGSHWEVTGLLRGSKGLLQLSPKVWSKHRTALTGSRWGRVFLEEGAVTVKTLGENPV